jgi:hypothetical protein
MTGKAPRARDEVGEWGFICPRRENQWWVKEKRREGKRKGLRLRLLLFHRQTLVLVR